MIDIQPRKGKGRFQWSGAAWSGGLLGGNAFMIVAGLAILTKSPAIGIAWLSSYSISVTFGCRLQIIGFEDNFEAGMRFH